MTEPMAKFDWLGNTLSTAVLPKPSVLPEPSLNELMSRHAWYHDTIAESGIDPHANMEVWYQIITNPWCSVDIIPPDRDDAEDSSSGDEESSDGDSEEPGPSPKATPAMFASIKPAVTRQTDSTVPLARGPRNRRKVRGGGSNTPANQSRRSA